MGWHEICFVNPLPLQQSGVTEFRTTNIGVGIITTSIPLWSLYKMYYNNSQNPVLIIEAPILRFGVLGGLLQQGASQPDFGSRVL